MARLLLVAAVLAGWAGGGCKQGGDKGEGKAAQGSGSAAAATGACAAATAAAGKPGHGALPWIHDDYAAALACAKARGVPVVLDLWAPWCHTCLSMQSTVFTDASFAPRAGEFVYAALDTDREVNAAIVDKFPLSAWPTFYVIGPDEGVLARFVGAASVAQFHAFLDAGARAGTGAAAGPDAHLLAAERAIAAKDPDTAERELAAALAAAPADWPRRADALVSLIGTKHKRKDLAGCLEVAERSLDDTGRAASASDFLYHATACADAAVKAAGDGATDPTTDPALGARVTKLRERAVARWQALVADAEAPLSVDDRSDALANLRTTLAALGRDDEARAAAEQQRALLDDAAAKAPTPMAEMTFIWPRAEVYVYLGRPLDLAPSLERLATKLPAEYDVPARLGWIYLKGGKLDDAARATDAALRLCYGPRKARVLNQRIDIAVAAGDQAAERLFREELVKTYEALPAGQAQPEALAKARQALTALGATP